MKTIDIHTHLLNPDVRFDRLYDKLTLRFFARALGADPAELLLRPYETYVQSMARAIADADHLEKACVFGVDVRLDKHGREVHRDKTVCAANRDVIEVARRYPQQFIPFFSINPRRPGALDLIDEQIELGCRGAKFLQNYWGVDLNDERFVPYYEKLVQHRVPLIIHIGSEYSISSYARFEHTDMLDLPLACGVTVIAAHMGLGRVQDRVRLWRNLSRQPKCFDQDYFDLLDRLQRHDNLYADISAILAPLRARALRHLSQQRQVHHKLLFGTDYPVPFTIRVNTLDLPRAAKQRICSVPNPFDRYIETILEYFPKGHPIYHNHTKVLPG